MTVIQNLIYRRQQVGLERTQTSSADLSWRLGSRLQSILNMERETHEQFFERTLWIPVCFALGAAAYFSQRSEPQLVFHAGLFVALILLFLGVSRLQVSLRALPNFLLILCLCVASGFSYSALRTHSITRSTLIEPVDRVMVEGWLTEISGNGERTRYLIKVHAVSGLAEAATPEYVRLTLRVEDDFEPGRFVRCFAGLRPPPSAMLPGDYNFSQQAFFDRLDAVGFVYGRCKPGRIGHAENWSVKALAALNVKRHRAAQHIASTNGESPGAGLAAAMMTGDRSFLRPIDQENLQRSGLAHLLAISGLHMGLAAGVFYIALFRMLALIEPIAKRFPIQKIAKLGALLAITVYLAFSGAGISTQRAYVMLGIGIVFALLDRPIVSFQALATSMIIVLLLTPSAVMTPGFQMSFAATAALIGAFKTQYKMRAGMLGSGILAKLESFLRSLFITSWVAGLATLPFALYHFDRAATLGFLANLIVMPVITLVSVPLASLSAVLSPFGLEELSLKLLAVTLDFVLEMASLFSGDLPLPDWLEFGRFPVLAAILSTLGLLIWTIHGKPARASALGVICVSILVWAATPQPLLINDGHGHVYARTGTGFSEINLGVG